MLLFEKLILAFSSISEKLILVVSSFLKREYLLFVFEKLILAVSASS